MGKPNTFYTDGWLNTNTTFRAYVEDDATGTIIAQAAVSAITYTVTESVGPQQGKVTANVVSLTPVSTYILAALSLTGWREDQTGFNFQATLPAAVFPDAGDYVVDFIGTLASDGSTFVLAKCFHHCKSRS